MIDNERLFLSRELRFIEIAKCIQVVYDFRLVESLFCPINELILSN